MVLSLRKKNKIQIGDVVAGSENRGDEFGKRWDAETRAEGGGGPENNKEVYHVLVGLVARCLRDKNRVPTSIQALAPAPPMDALT